MKTVIIIILLLLLSLVLFYNKESENFTTDLSRYLPLPEFRPSWRFGKWDYVDPYQFNYGYYPYYPYPYYWR